MAKNHLLNFQSIFLKILVLIMMSLLSDDDAPALLPRVYTELTQSKLLCKVPGAFLYGDFYIFRMERVRNLANCAAICAQKKDCLSANYRYSTGDCTINNATSFGHEMFFLENLGTDYIHLTSQKCSATD